MKKEIIFLCIILITVNFGIAQEVEKIYETTEIIYRAKVVDVSPKGILVDEVNNSMHIVNGGKSGAWVYDMHSKQLYFENNYPVENGEIRKKLADNKISWLDDSIFINKDTELIVNLLYKVSCGISFILKKDDGYIVYFVYEGGSPGAVDTTGKIYSSKEAMEYLKEYDPEKYAESLARAEELGLKSDFEKSNVLIWGQTYYTSTKIMESFYRDKDPYIINGLIQYDNQGYGYQMTFRYNDMESKLCIVNPNSERETIVLIKEYSNILSTYVDGSNRKYFSASYYVGYGGNIYYYIAGEEYTEVFRIRRTWGTPDMYAMAINGFTEDNYGKYVEETLATMSKSDLRLLRNTIFALYGVHFKSEDLSKHFAKEVWYTDEGKTSGEVELPAHRQKLVEMIQELEKK